MTRGNFLGDYLVGFWVALVSDVRRRTLTLTLTPNPIERLHADIPLLTLTLKEN